MSDLIATGLAWLTQQLKAYASETVTYARGQNQVDVQATFGRKLLKLDDGSGVRVEWTDLDFLIPAADLTFDGVTPITPQRGDVVYVGQGTDLQTFQVFPFGGEPPWRWADPHQTMFRIHTKYINVQTAFQ
jgi:hypothetical protein